MTYSDRETEKRLQTLEKRITKEYRKAWQELDKTASAYFAEYKERWEREYEKYLGGAYTKQQWEAWQATQLARGNRWEQMRDEMAERITDANVVATAYINDDTPSIFSLNYNFSAYEIEQGTGIAFNIYDEQTVKRLIKDNPQLLPKPSVNINKTIKWNQQKLTSALVSGILQGKPIGKIASEFQNVTDMNRKSAIRNARTAYTGAQNSGRQESYKYAVENYGIVMEKEWIATADLRTRDSHARLDGVRVEYDDEFPNGLMYPADPDGEPSEVYNCRCTIRAVLPKYANAKAHVTGNDVESYKEWLREKENAIIINKEESIKVVSDIEKNNYAQNLNDALWESYKNHVDLNNLELVTSEDVRDYAINVNFGKMDKESQEIFSKTISKLSIEYDSTLTKVRTMTKEEAFGNSAFATTFHSYTVDNSEMLINPLKCADSKKLEERIRELSNNGYAVKLIEGKESQYIATHEFAHTLIDTGSELHNKTNWANADYNKVKKIRKELNSIYNDYIEEYSVIDKAVKKEELNALESFDTEAWDKASKLAQERDKIIVSRYSLSNADEFMAECFTASKLGNYEDNKYVKKVMDLIDRNYRRK